MLKAGILGGGQLGRMFLQAARNYPLHTSILDPNPQAAARCLADRFVCGDFRDRQTVLDFGSDCDVISIEIEDVHCGALRELAAAGKRVVPHPDVLATIQDKGQQKLFYQKHALPSPEFVLIDGIHDPRAAEFPTPFVQKLRSGGYDGRGVQVIHTDEERDKLWNAPSLLEPYLDLAKEVAVLVVQNEQGEHAVYAPVEMVFDPELHLVDYLFAPASGSAQQTHAAKELAQRVARAFASPGLYAVEMFWDKAGQLWLNETAPRLHNSAHHTIEAAFSSQFDQMTRLLLGMPLGDPQLHSVAAMLNLIGAAGQRGEAYLHGMPQLLAQARASLHWYGKGQTQPGRKMGHVTLLADDLASLHAQVKELKEFLTVNAEEA